MNILYVEDDPRDADLTRRELAKSAPHFRLDTVTTFSEALARLEESEARCYELILTDLRLPDGDGLALLTCVREQALPLAVVIITGRGDEEAAVAALKAGADDYVIKRQDYLTRLSLTLENALHRFRAEVARRARPLRVLYAEHNAADIDLTRRHLARHAPYIHLDVVHTAPEVLQRLLQTSEVSETSKVCYDVFLLDYYLPGLNALEVLKELRQACGLGVPVVLVTGRGDEETAVQALRLGATDYVVKNPGYLYQLPSVLENAFYRAQLAREQAALRASEEKYRTLFETMAQGVVYQDADGKIISANPAAERILGLTLDQMQGRTSMDPRWKAIHEDGSDFYGETHPSMVALQTGAEVRNVVMGVFNPEKEDYVWIDIHAMPQFKSGEDKPYQVYTTFDDITERKRAEEELRQLKEFNESIVQNMAEGIMMEDAEGYLTFVNPAAATLLGYAPEELLGQHWTAATSPDQQPIVQAANERRMRGKADRYELELVRKDGRRVPVLVSGSPGFEEGRFVGTLAVFTDIAERKRAERLLQALNAAALAMERALTHEEIFAAVAKELKKLGFSCLVLLADENQSQLFPTYLSYETKVLQAVEKLVGIRHEKFSISVEAVDVYREVVWKKRAIFLENAEDAMRQLLPRPVKRLAGQMAKMLKIPKSIPAPLIMEDQVIGVFSVQSDDLTADDVPAITAFAHQMAAAWRKAQLMQDLQHSLEELKRTQAQLLQLQKMEAIGQLAAGIAHDFNNLLTPIGGFAELLLWKAVEGSKAQGYLRQIKAAAERAAALTGQLRLFTRQAGGERRPTQLNDVVEETRALLERSIPKEIAIELHLEPELWVVEADPSQVNSVLMNLGVNARDAMPDGGTLTLETRNVTLDEDYARTVLAARPGRYVCLSVSDTGCGMSPEVQARLFEPFFTTKEQGKGTGLGLSVVYGIVKGHDGFIQVYSEEGRGSVFHVYLPAVEGAVEKREAERLEWPTGTETILVVDDEEGVRKLGQAVLEGCGYTVLMAEDGARAMEVYQAHRGEIALVVLDVIMPQMSGLECLRRLRELDPPVKVLISTGYTARSLAEELLAEGALGVVEKPFRIQDFAVAVRAAIVRP
jgi:PAS domain S-box-containing protein